MIIYISLGKKKERKSMPVDDVHFMYENHALTLAGRLWKGTVKIDLTQDETTFLKQMILKELKA